MQSSHLEIMQSSSHLVFLHGFDDDKKIQLITEPALSVLRSNGTLASDPTLQDGGNVTVCLHRDSLLLLAGSEPHTNALISLALSLPSTRLSQWLSIALNGIARENGGHEVLSKQQLALASKYVNLNDTQKRYLGVFALRKFLSLQLEQAGFNLPPPSSQSDRLLSKVRSDGEVSDVLVQKNSATHGIASKGENCYELKSMMYKDLRGVFLNEDGNTLSVAFEDLVTDISVLFFGCGFGGSLCRSLSLMVLGLSGLARFPCPDGGEQAMCLFPNKEAWTQVKRARNWLTDIREVVSTNLRKGPRESLREGTLMITSSLLTLLQPTSQTTTTMASSSCTDGNPSSLFVFKSSLLPMAPVSPSSSSSSSTPSSISSSTSTSLLYKFFHQEWVQERASPVPIYASGLITVTHYLRALGDFCKKSATHSTHSSRRISSTSSSASSSSSDSRLIDASTWTIETLITEKRSLSIVSLLRTSDATEEIGSLLLLLSSQILYFLSTLPTAEAAGTRSRLRPLSWRLLLETLLEAGAYPLVQSLAMRAKSDLSNVSVDGHCALDPHAVAELDRLLAVARGAQVKKMKRLAAEEAKRSKLRIKDDDQSDYSSNSDNDDDGEFETDELISGFDFPTAATRLLTGVSPKASDAFRIDEDESSMIKTLPTIAVRANFWTQVVSTISLSAQSNYHTVATVGGLPGGGPLGLSTGGPKDGNFGTVKPASKAMVTSRKRGRHSPTISSASSSSSPSSSSSAPLIILPGRSKVYFVCPDENSKNIVPGTVERVASDAISRHCGSTQRLVEDMRESAYLVKGQNTNFASDEQEHLTVLDYTYRMKGEAQHWRELEEDFKAMYLKAFEKEAKDLMALVKTTTTIQCSGCHERLASLLCKNDPKYCGKCCPCGNHVLTTHKGAFYEHFTGKPRPITMAPSGFDMHHALKSIMIRREKAKEDEVRKSVDVSLPVIMHSRGNIGDVSAISRKGHLQKRVLKDDRPAVVVSSVYGVPFDLIEDLTCFQVKKRKLDDKEGEFDEVESILESDSVEDLPMSTVSGLLSSKVFVKDAGLAFTTPANRSVKVTYGENALWSTFYALLCSPIDLACETREDSAAIRHPWVTSHPSGGFSIISSSSSTSPLLHHIETMATIRGCQMGEIVSEASHSLFGVLMPRLRHDLFPKTTLDGIAHAGGGEAMSVVLSRLAKHYVSSFSGLPDIAVWDDPQTCPFCSEEHRHVHAQFAKSSSSSKDAVEETKVAPRLALVEVKSSSDSLSRHQLEWIDHLNKCNSSTRKTKEGFAAKALPAGVLHIVT